MFWSAVKVTIGGKQDIYRTPLSEEAVDTYNKPSSKQSLVCVQEESGRRREFRLKGQIKTSSSCCTKVNYDATVLCIYSPSKSSSFAMEITLL